MIPAPHEPVDVERPPAITEPMRVPLPFHQPLWTFVFLAVNVLLWLAMTFSGGSENPRVLINFGAKLNSRIINGEYWRLLTACFLHIGFVHLMFNSYALFSFGVEVERRYGWERFLALYLLSGISGTVLSFVGNRALSAGASGAIFGLVGATIAYFASYRDEFGHWGRRQLLSVLIVAAYNLMWGFAVPGIDNLGHIGGLASGLLLGWAYCPRYQLVRTESISTPYIMIDRFKPAIARLVSLGLVILLVLLTYMGVRTQSSVGVFMRR